MIRRLTLIAFTLGVCCYASPIGFLGIGSSGFVTARLTSTLFTLDPAVLGLCPGAPCNGDVNTATTLAFVGGPLAPNEGVLINGGFPLGSPPPAGATIFNPFLQFAAHGLQFMIVGIDPGTTNTNCVGLTTGQSCSILENGSPSPVILTRSGSNTNVAISMHGTVADASGVSTWTGGFSATLPNITPLQVEQFFCGADAVCTPGEIAASPTLTVRSVSGSFFATPVDIPEPASTVLFGIGAALLAAGLRFRRSR